MLVLARKIEEAILLDGGRIRISVLDVRGGRVKLGIEAPRSVPVERELSEREPSDDNPAHRMASLTR